MNAEYNNRTGISCLNMGSNPEIGVAYISEGRIEFLESELEPKKRTESPQRQIPLQPNLVVKADQP